MDSSESDAVLEAMLDGEVEVVRKLQFERHYSEIRTFGAAAGTSAIAFGTR